MHRRPTDHTGDRMDVAFPAQVERIEEELIAIRRQLHAYPEPSGEEVETSRLIRQRLTEAGIDARVCRSDTGKPVGVVADLTVGHPAADCPRIALRADIDALRMPDEKRVDYSSRNPGVAHSCGHDSHTAMVLGAALAARALDQGAAKEQPAFGMKLRFLFQPAEETSLGARWLVDQGAVEDVDAIMGLHVDPERPAGQVGIRYGVLTAFCDEVEIVIEGHGGHAARPHHSVDPIAAAARVIGSLYEFLPRFVDSRNPSVFSIGKIAGGYAPNVIPERVELLGTLRTTNAADREILKQRIRDTCAGTERILGVRATVRFLVPLQAVNNAVHVTEALEQAARLTLGDENVLLIDRPSMGGEDFSVYLERIPGALLRLGCAGAAQPAPFLHSPVFDIDERCIGLGTKILLRAAVLLTRSLRTADRE